MTVALVLHNLIILIILYQDCHSQLTTCTSTSCIASDVGAITYRCTDTVSTCTIDCNTGCNNLIIQSSATTTTINCMNSNSCTNLQLFCGYNSNNKVMNECKLNCRNSDSCNDVNVECNGNIANCGIGPSSFNPNTHAIDGDLTCNLSEQSNICSLDCGSNGAVCDTGKTSKITCTANNIGSCFCVNPCGSNVNIIKLTSIPSSITSNPSYNPTINPLSLSPSIYPTNNPSTTLSPTYTPSINPISSINTTPSPSISPTNNPITSKQPTNTPITTPTATPTTNIPSKSPVSINIPSTSPISMASPSISPVFSDTPSKSLSIGTPTASPLDIEMITNIPTTAPSVARTAAVKPSFFEKQILWIIIIGSVVLICICCIIIFLLCRTRKLYDMKKERESHKMVEHVNMSIVPITPNDDDYDDNTAISINHHKQRSTSVMIKKYLNAQQMEPVGDVSPTLSNEPNETDLEASINTFTAAAAHIVNTRNMSMQTQTSRNQQGQSMSNYQHKQSQSKTRGVSEITMSDIIQEMDTPEHEYGPFDPQKYYSDAQRQHIKQNQRKEKGLITANDIISDETETDKMIPNPPQIAIQGVHKSTFDRNLDDVVNTNDMLMGNVVRDMAKSHYQKQPNLSPTTVPLKSGQNEDDMIHNPPQISMNKPHKSTFDRNLDDVISTNEMLMGNVVRDMAKSRYMKQQKQQQEETQIVPLKGGDNEDMMHNQHKSTFDRNLDDVVNTNDMLMGNVVRDMAKSRYQKQQKLSPKIVPLKGGKKDGDEAMIHSPPQISMKKLHKSTFDRNLDDVVNTNEVLMGNVVRDMAKSRYQKQQQQEEETQIIALKSGNNGHNPPQISMKKPHKSTFDRNLDDVVDTNEMLMGNVVRDMAKSRYMKQQNGSSEVVNNNNNNAHKSTFDVKLDNVVDTNEALMGRVVNEMEESRLKLYGFEKDKPRHNMSLEQFVPPSPENTFPAINMSFNTKLHTTTYSQDLLMDDILNDIAKKENKFSGGH